MAEVPALNRLSVTSYSDCCPEEASPAELALLARVRCRELLIPQGAGLPLFGQLLLSVQAERVICHQFIGQKTCSPLDWRWLAARPGIIKLELLSMTKDEPDVKLVVEGCPGSLPSFAEPWALVLLLHPPQERVIGLHLGRFLPGPDGLLVWSNSATLDAILHAALARMSASLT